VYITRCVTRALVSSAHLITFAHLGRLVTRPLARTRCTYLIYIECVVFPLLVFMQFQRKCISFVKRELAAA
jgi:hypothetical protein